MTPTILFPNSVMIEVGPTYSHAHRAHMNMQTRVNRNEVGSLSLFLKNNFFSRITSFMKKIIVRKQFGEKNRDVFGKSIRFKGSGFKKFRKKLTDARFIKF